MPDVQTTIDTVQQAVSNSDLSYSKVMYALVILGAGALIIRLLLMAQNRILQRSPLHDSIKKVLFNVNKFLLWAVLVFIELGYLHIEVSSLVALLSITVFAISLALQSLLANVAGGLLILSTHPYAIGDYVEVGDVAGTVVETGVFYTRLRTFDNKRVQVPNSQVTEEKIINYTAEKTRRIDIRFHIPYSQPVEKVKEAALRVLEAHPEILPDPLPTVRVSGFMENSIEYFIRAWCPNPRFWDTYFDVMEGIKAEFDREGIEMAYNHLNVHMAPRDE